MKVLILGANGMLGHKLFQVLSQSCDVAGTIRGTFADVRRYGIFKESQIIPGIEATDIAKVAKAIEGVRPDVAVNGIGIVKALSEKSGTMLNIWLNALFPHQLYSLCQNQNIRLIHVSTDCVFSGRKGGYREDDPSDAEDIYGKTKYLGEVSGPGALTVRTSIIGRELAGANGLLEWFLANKGGAVNGWANAIFSGFPTLHLAGIIEDIIKNHQDLSGLYQVSSEPISKYDLLALINKAMRLKIKINKSPEPRCDRSLDSSRYRRQTGFRPPAWDKMVEEMVKDSAQYLRWR